MKFGLTHGQRKLIQDTPTDVFAWLPIRLEDGRRAWLEMVRKHYFRDPSPTWAGDDSYYYYRGFE